MSGSLLEDFLLFCEVSACQMCSRTSLESFLSFWLFIMLQTGSSSRPILRTISPWWVHWSTRHMCSKALWPSMATLAQENGVSTLMPLELVIELMSYCDPTPQRENTAKHGQSLLQSRHATPPPCACLDIGAIVGQRPGWATRMKGEENVTVNAIGRMQYGGRAQLALGCSLEAWLDFWRLLAAARGIRAVLEMLYRVGFVGFESDSDTNGMRMLEKGAAILHPPSCTWTRSPHVCVIDCSSKATCGSLFPLRCRERICDDSSQVQVATCRDGREPC